jgi:hypothetical protein
MKNVFKKFGILFLILVAILFLVYLYFTNFGQRGIFTAEPRKPKYEIPIKYTIGWWAHQEDLTIDSFKVTIEESKLNLFNAKSLISYSIIGQVKIKNTWQPSIREVHISERINSDSTQSFDRIIEITPIVGVEENKNLNGGVTTFKFKNEHTIVSNKWGINKIKFICGQKEQIIELKQRK